MGTWGHGPFDNDDAADFLGDLEDSRKPARSLGDALSSAAESTDYLEAPEGSIAVAAATVVAIVTNGDVPSVSEDDAGRVRELGVSPDDGRPLVPAAQAALDRVDAKDSELLELWDEAGETEAWRAVLTQVRGALAPG